MLLFVGYVVEVAGLLVTGLGLWRTWQLNAEQPFWPAPVRRASRWVLRYVLRRGPKAHIGGGSVAAVTAIARGGGFAGYAPPAGTLDERVAYLEQRTKQILQEAGALRSAIDAEGRERKRDVRRLGDALDRAQVELTRLSRRLVVEGIRLSAAGVFLLAVGLVLQATATLTD